MTLPQSKVKVDSIESYDPPSGSISLSQGATVPAGQTFNVLTNASFSGVVTATSFVGDASNMSNLTIVGLSKAISISLVTN